MNKKEVNKKNDSIIKIILIIIIIILLLHNCCIISKEKKNNKKTPTGNVDIIEIICDKEDTCEINDNNSTDQKITNNNNDNIIRPDNITPRNNTTTNNNKNNNDSNENNNNNDNSEETEPEEDIKDLIVYDKNITWHGETPANIFTNSMYELKDRIMPEASNTYQFVVKNGTEYKLKYNIEFTENNPYFINMKYKLKKNNTYIIDHYVSANDLNVANALLNAKTNDTYYLEWKWISSDNDTEIGANSNSKYGLRIDIEAESTND